MAQAHAFLVTPIVTLFIHLIFLLLAHLATTMEVGDWRLKSKAAAAAADENISSNIDMLRIDLLHPDHTLSPSRILRLKAAAAAEEIGKANDMQFYAPLTYDALFSFGAYTMQIEVGTPPVRFQAYLMQSGDFSWVACSGFKGFPSLDPNKSSTYKTIPCEAPICEDLSRTCNNDTCGFEGGQYAYETLTMTTSHGVPHRINNFLLSCIDDAANINRNFPLRASVGLSRLGKFSLFGQLSPIIQNRFSYCLVPFPAAQNLTSPLRLGIAAKLNGLGWKTIPFLGNKAQESYHYWLNLKAISLGDTKVNMPTPDLIDPDQSLNGTAIDVGLPHTYVPANVLHKLRKVFIQDMPLAEGPKIFEKQCVNISGYKKHKFPQLTLHFETAEWPIPEENYLIRIAHDIVCLNMRWIGKTAKYGAKIGFLYQQGHEFHYDNLKSQLSFRRKDCATASRLSSL